VYASCFAASAAGFRAFWPFRASQPFRAFWPFRASLASTTATLPGLQRAASGGGHRTSVFRAARPRVGALAGAPLRASDQERHATAELARIRGDRRTLARRSTALDNAEPETTPTCPGWARCAELACWALVRNVRSGNPVLRWRYWYGRSNPSVDRPEGVRARRVPRIRRGGARWAPAGSERRARVGDLLEDDGKLMGYAGRAGATKAASSEQRSSYRQYA